MTLPYFKDDSAWRAPIHIAMARGGNVWSMVKTWYAHDGTSWRKAGIQEVITNYWKIFPGYGANSGMACAIGDYTSANGFSPRVVTFNAYGTILGTVDAYSGSANGVYDAIIFGGKCYAMWNEFGGGILRDIYVVSDFSAPTLVKLTGGTFNSLIPSSTTMRTATLSSGGIIMVGYLAVPISTGSHYSLGVPATTLGSLAIIGDTGYYISSSGATTTVRSTNMLTGVTSAHSTQSGGSAFNGIFSSGSRLFMMINTELYEYTGGAWSNIYSGLSMSGATFTEFYTAPSGDIIFALHGLYKISGSTVTQLSTAEHIIEQSSSGSAVYAVSTASGAGTVYVFDSGQSSSSVSYGFAKIKSYGSYAIALPKVVGNPKRISSSATITNESSYICYSSTLTSRLNDMFDLGQGYMLRSLDDTTLYKIPTPNV